MGGWVGGWVGGSCSATKNSSQTSQSRRKAETDAAANTFAEVIRAADGECSIATGSQDPKKHQNRI